MVCCDLQNRILLHGRLATQLYLRHVILLLSAPTASLALARHLSG